LGKGKRIEIYNKYQGRCAYCGQKITYEQMQKDHIHPRFKEHWLKSEKMKKINGTPLEINDIDDINNFNPACKRCNYIKATYSIEKFREIIANKIKTINNNSAYKMIKDYGLIIETKAPVVFYFEKYFLIGRIK